MVFDNGFNLPFGVSESCSELKKIVQKEMLKQAIDLHFEKEQTLFLQGIKALSLFFIDRVAIRTLIFWLEFKIKFEIVPAL